jgi:hypothetical protein
VPRKNRVGKLAETAISSLKVPRAAAEKVVDQAKGTVALGRTVAGTAGSVAGSVVSKAAGRAKSPAEGTGAGGAKPSPSRPDLRAVPGANEPAHTRPAAKKTEDSPKKHGDTLDTPSGAGTAKKAAGKKAAGKKAPARKTPAGKTAATKRQPGKAPAGKAAADRAPATKAPTEPDVAAKKAAEDARAAKAADARSRTEKAPPTKVDATPADVAEVVEHAVAEDPARTGAQPANATTGKKAPAEESGPGAKLPAKKAAAKKAPAKKAPAKKAAPRTPSEGPAAETPGAGGEEITTPAGTAAAAEGTNPDTGETDLTQPGTEPLVDPGTANTAASESEQLRQAAEKTPE